MLVAVRLRWESIGHFCIVSRNCTFSSLQQKPHGVLCWIFWLLFRKGFIYICYKIRKEISKAHRLLFGLVNPSRPRFWCLANPSLRLPFLKDSSIPRLSEGPRNQGSVSELVKILESTMTRRTSNQILQPSITKLSFDETLPSHFLGPCRRR